MSEPELLAVEQVDRNACADFEASLGQMHESYIEAVRRGCYDDHKGPQAFARHRINATRPADQVEAVDWRSLRHIARQQTSTGSGFASIDDDAWQELAAAIAALPRVSRNDVLEEAANLAEAEKGIYSHGNPMYGPSVGPKIAAAIRERKE
jgi:hypothetical protein